MHQEFRQLRYVVRWLTPPVARHPRAAQRALAADMRASLGAGWGLLSHSHSRGAVAVAAGNPPLTRLGVDLEYIDPKRPWRDIAAIYVPNGATAGEADASAVCRAWTFGEAYFKAFGAAPGPDILSRVFEAPPQDDEPACFASRRYWYSERLPDDFWLSLVWEEEI
ncbi:MAG: hypothetical protein GC155_02330 [Alphaproteobacteria bacterium]|nr:hypothetical protein [Alphaproteobacteria bacterium]